VNSLPDRKKRGRPESSSPKSVPLRIRLNSKTEEILKIYCEKHGINKTDAVQEAIFRLSLDDKYWTKLMTDKLIEHTNELEDNSKKMKKILDESEKLLETHKLMLNKIKMYEE
jgi:hypothetical protein